jgi:hypothetical protein
MIRPGSAKLKKGYRCWSIVVTNKLDEIDATLTEMVAEGSWCFLGVAQQLVERLNRMSESEVNDFIDRGDLAAFLECHMRRGPGKNKRDRPFTL